jgi:predicted small secreted protein
VAVTWRALTHHDESVEPPTSLAVHLNGAQQLGRRDALRRCKVKKLLVMLALSCGLFVSACNTVEGVGKDAKSVGECADGKPGNC